MTVTRQLSPAPGPPTRPGGARLRHSDAGPGAGPPAGEWQPDSEPQWQWHWQPGRRGRGHGRRHGRGGRHGHSARRRSGRTAIPGAAQLSEPRTARGRRRSFTIITKTKPRQHRAPSRILDPLICRVSLNQKVQGPRGPWRAGQGLTSDGQTHYGLHDEAQAVRGRQVAWPPACRSMYTTSRRMFGM